MLSIEDAATRALVVDAVLKAIPQEKRDQLVKDALAQLMVPKQSGLYGDKSSHLEDAFRGATFDMARQHAKEWLEKDPRFAKAVQELTLGVVERMLEPTAREKILDGIVSAVTTAFEKAASSYR